MTTTPTQNRESSHAANGRHGAASERHETPAPASMTREDWDRRYDTPDYIWTTDANRFLKRETDRLAPGNAIDLGAGEARNAVWLASLGWTVHAVDFSAVGLAKGRQLADARRVGHRVTFETADLRDHVPAARGYALVAMIYLQMPWDELVPIVRRAADAVAPGGTFLLVAHDATNLTQGYGGPQRPDLLYTAEQVVEALDGALDVTFASRVDKPMQTPDGPKMAYDCLVRGRRI